LLTDKRGGGKTVIVAGIRFYFETKTGTLNIWFHVLCEGRGEKTKYLTCQAMERA
jgi:hypothetical protein